MDTSINPYQVLGIRPGADLTEIKAAYRKRMMQCHPDKGGSDAEAKMVNAAFEMLTKPQPQLVPVYYQPTVVRVVFYGNWSSSGTTTTGYW